MPVCMALHNLFLIFPGKLKRMSRYQPQKQNIGWFCFQREMSNNPHLHIFHSKHIYVKHNCYCSAIILNCVSNIPRSQSSI